MYWNPLLMLSNECPGLKPLGKKPASPYNVGYFFMSKELKALQQYHTIEITVIHSWIFMFLKLKSQSNLGWKAFPEILWSDPLSTQGQFKLGNLN